MNKRQKVARLQLIIIAVAALASVINSMFYMHRHGFTFSRAWWLGSGWPVVFCFFGVMLAPLFFRKKKGRVDFDERDLMIDNRASRIALGASYSFFMLACMAIWVSVGIDTPIPAYWLGRIILGGWLTTALVHALTTTICYAWEGGRHE
jgi:hypothetical protein